jgi:hypothetical protein
MLLFECILWLATTHSFPQWSSFPYFRNVWKSLQLGTAQLGATQCVTQRESDMPLAAYPCPVDAEIEKCLCVFITTVPNTKLCAWGEEDSGGHVL